MKLRLSILTLFVMLPTLLFAQYFSDLANGLHADVELSGTAATGDYAPLWLSSNKQGLVSVQNKSIYFRMGAFREIENDSLKKWKRGYGVDLQVAGGSQSVFMIHQLYGEIQFMKARLMLGQKERKIDLRNNELTSGGMSLGINATPIPQLRLDIDPFSFPGTKGWWKWSGRFGFGITTDGKWQKDFTEEKTRYTSNHLYHEKALYWKFGKETARVVPLTFEVGIQMMTQFGGTSYHVNGRNTVDATMKHDVNAEAFINAIICQGSDATDGTEANTAGNTLGSYNMRLAWRGNYGKKNEWEVGAYFERFFEDQSYLTVQYGIFFDHLLGIDAKLPKNPYLSNIVLEHLNTRNQSGAVYHDQTASIPDKMNGRDDYYNHNIYSGWQHWGMGLGNPLLTSPIYNNDGTIEFKNNRVKAWHVGLAGDPIKQLHWRLLMSFSENWGNYQTPFYEKRLQQHFLAEVSWMPEFKGKTAIAKGWKGTLAFGYDHGNMPEIGISNSFGAQLTIRKRFQLVK